MTPVLTSDAVSGSGLEVIARPDRTLLVVDDDPSVRHALWITFREQYVVQLAESGPKALELFQFKTADVALLDRDMRVSINTKRPGEVGLRARSLDSMEPRPRLV